MTNREIIEKAIKKEGYVIGCYDDDIEKIAKKQLNEILVDALEDYRDIYLYIRGRLHILEVATVEKEKDFKLFTSVQYFKQYGNLEDALDSGTITQVQYDEINEQI